MPKTPIENLGTNLEDSHAPVNINNYYGDAAKKAQTTGPIPKFLPIDFPERIKYFTGREKVLENIAAALQTTGSAAFADTNGAGKSSVAKEFAYLNQENYEHNLFIRATTGEFDLSISKLLDSLKFDLPADTTAEHKLVYFVQWLTENQNWLLLVDNVDDVAAIKQCRFNKPGGHVIYTSNDPLIYKVGTKVDLPKMSPENAMLLLYKHWHEKPDLEFAAIPEKHLDSLNGIATKFGNHPFSMAFVGSYLADRDESLDEFLETYESKHADLLRKYHFLSDYEHGEVATAFLLRFEQITTPRDKSKREKFLSVAVADYLKLSAFLSPDNIPEELLQQCLAELHPDKNEFTEDKDFVREIYARFKPTSIFKRDAETTTLSTHRIIQEVTRFQISDEEDLLLLTLATVLSDNFEHFDFTNKELVERYIAHVGIFLEYLEANNTKEQARLKLENASTAHLCNRYGRYFELYGQYSKAEKYNELFKDICENAKHTDEMLTATSYNNLAVVYELQRRYEEAEPLFKKAILIRENKKGAIDPDIAPNYNNLAELYRTQGRYDEAETLFKKALAICEGAFGYEDNRTATCYHNLAMLYEGQERYEEAGSLYKKAVEIKEKVLGENHPDTATSYFSFGAFYHKHGRHSEGLKLCEKALEIYKKMLPIGHEKIMLCESWVNGIKNVSNKQQKIAGGYRITESGKRKKKRWKK